MTPYQVVGGSVVEAVPPECPYRQAGDDACLPRQSHLRLRKTGPCHPLAVKHCQLHGHAYTLYPPGFAPYQRRAVERRSIAGQLLVVEEAPAVTVDFGGTLFEAALDAADGRAWPRCFSPDEALDRWWGTQGRHLEITSRIVGVAMAQQEREREVLASLLGVDMLRRHDSLERPPRTVLTVGCGSCNDGSRSIWILKGGAPWPGSWRKPRTDSAKWCGWP